MKLFETVAGWLGRAVRALDTAELRLGQTEVTLRNLILLVASVLLLFYVTARLKHWLVRRILSRSQMDVSARHAAGTLFGYFVLFVGLLVIFQTVGIDLTALTVVAGAIGVGIAFGLRDIANNFLSGLIILFERPVKLGDRIEVGNVEGDVVAIRARSTTVVTNDNVAIIIPNSKFMTENVVNWSYTDSRIRFRVPVQVAYGTELRRLEQTLLQIARNNPEVLTDPPPAVRLMAFGESGLDLELRVWTDSSLHRRGKLVSDLNFEIERVFREEGIQIPYPQRDVHLR
ncbi:MAG TPA: mechanosensitive ion channel domain-containing protein [Thermoanaerobaculia bacterium]|nr:mechanosensitive ion channel domain-containing protein [Thermoanaerobaculia bacterium]